MASAFNTVGFIGLGNIGRPMAEKLLAGDFAVQVYDVFPDAAASVVEAGASLASGPAEMARACQYIGLCVRDDNDVESLLFGDEGILSNAQQGLVVAVHSTVTQANLLKWADVARQSGVELLDAPITGGASGAEQGTLCYMVGGQASVRPATEKRKAG